MAKSFATPEVFPLRGDNEWDERFVQDLIAADPSLLGLGDLELRQKERTQPGRGRLDILLQSEDRQAWYEVEVQLGPTDESHIIRTIEYWDVERKRYPEISHTAVIVAEEITSRFFNVINLFNQAIPLIAIKMTAVKVGDQSTILFTKVLDYLPKGLEESGGNEKAVDRAFWDRRVGTALLPYVDQIFAAVRDIDPTAELKFNQNYITTQVSGEPSGFVTFQPQVKALRISLHIAQSAEVDEELDKQGISWEYRSGRYPCYRLRVLFGSVDQHLALLRGLVVRAYKEVEGAPTNA